jgi:hypothetical protein
VDKTYATVPLYRCADCGFLFAPQREVEELHEIYDDSYFEQYPGGEAYDADQEQRRYEARPRLEWVRERVTRGRLLEIGAADGIFLDEARAAGFRVTGVEPAPGLAATARDERNIDVRAGFIEDVELPDEKFDAICAWHVLEHITQPAASIQRLRDAIFLEIPNIESTKAKARGPEWFHLDPSNHVGFYTPEQLGRLLGDNGFELVEWYSVSGFSYQRPGRAFQPRELAGRALETVQTRTLPGRVHPWKHELLRAAARPSSAY